MRSPLQLQHRINCMSFRKTFVESDNIQAIEYDSFMENLTVFFKNGAVYDYVGVPSETADEFLSAPSKSWYLKNRVVPFYDHMKKENKK